MSDFHRIFQALEASGVRYLVVGGVAVVLHGHPRFTADLDLVVSLDPDNALATCHARAIRADLGTTKAAVVSLDDLIDLKRGLADPAISRTLLLSKRSRRRRPMADHGNGWDRHAKEQRRAWLRLTYRQRLSWLEQAKLFNEVALGAARLPPVARIKGDIAGPVSTDHEGNWG